MEEEDGATGLS